MTEMTPQPRFRIPAWLAVLLILLVTGAGGFYVYRFAFGGKDSSDTIVVGKGYYPPQYYRPRSMVEARPSVASQWGFGSPAEGIARRGSGPVTIRRGQAVLRAYPDKKGSYDLTFDYLGAARQAWVTPAQWSLHELANRIIYDATLAQQRQVSDDQKQKLRALTLAVAITPAERSNLLSLIAAWEKAAQGSKDPPGMKLLTAVGDLGTAHLPEAKAALLHRAQQIQTILTPQQLEQARSGRTPAPASQPAGG